MSQKIGSICIIDDEEVNRFIIRKQIETINMVSTILEFPNGEKAWDYFQYLPNDQTKTPEIIFLDINMPKMDGWQFLEQFITKEFLIQNKALIYVTSSSSDKRDIEKANNIDLITDYLVKPITIDQLKDIFDLLLSKKANE